MPQSSALALLPSVDKAVALLRAEGVCLPLSLLTHSVRQSIATIREALLRGEDITPTDMVGIVRKGAKEWSEKRLQRVINATGVLLHTNLGRAPLGGGLSELSGSLLEGYSNVEYSLLTGKRGKRGEYLEWALSCLCQSEAACMVNNCASALILMLSVFCQDEKNEVIVSRGELVEIGGGFRIPDILRQANARLIEVGTTNKTHLRDYEQAMSDKTALILKVHRSNFSLEGFVAEVPTEALSALAEQHGVPFVEDVGSGAVFHTDALAPIPREPSVQSLLAKGVECVSFSGDKLFGGPQAGLIVGKRTWVERFKKAPLYRALRCDKLIYAALQACIESYLNAPKNPPLPLHKMLSITVPALQERCKKLINKLSPSFQCLCQIREHEARTGGGTMPQSAIPSCGIWIDCHGKEEVLADILRHGKMPVVVCVEQGGILLDLRSVFLEEDSILVESLNSAIGLL